MLFTNPPAKRSPSWNKAQGPLQPPTPFMAYGSFRNCTRQNHGTAGNREAGGFLNSAVRRMVFCPPPYEPPGESFIT